VAAAKIELDRKAAAHKPSFLCKVTELV